MVLYQETIAACKKKSCPLSPKKKRPVIEMAPVPCW
jgi:hypothetical protein